MAALYNRLASMEEVDRNRKVTESDVIDTSETPVGRRDRAQVGVAEDSDESLLNQGKCCRAGDLQLALIAEQEVVKGHVQSRNPDPKARRNATHASAVEGAGAAISAWDAEECNPVSGQNLTGAEGKSRGGHASAAKVRRRST